MKSGKSCSSLQKNMYMPCVSSNKTLGFSNKTLGFSNKDSSFNTPPWTSASRPRSSRTHQRRSRHVGHQAICAADLGRPSSSSSRRVAKCLRSTGLSTHLVMMSETFSVPGIFKSSKSPPRTRSWIHRSATARCRTRPNPRLRHMPMAAIESDEIVRGQAKVKSEHKD